MTKIDKLEEELYREEDQPLLEERLHHRVLFPKQEKKLPSSWRELGAEARDARISLASRPLLKYVVYGGILLFVIGGSIFTYFYMSGSGSEAEVGIQGREAIEAGEVLTIPIVFKNKSRSAFEDVELVVVLPPDSLLNETGIDQPPPARVTKHIGTVNPRAEEVIELKTRLFGKEGERKEVRVSIAYRPHNLRATFEAKQSKIFTIERVPLAVSWDIPPTLARGQDLEFKVHYSSTASKSFGNLWLKLEYPAGFTYKSAGPSPTEGETLWNIGTLEGGKEGIITVRGTIVGEEGEAKTFKGELGTYVSSSKEWHSYRDAFNEIKIAVKPLSIETVLHRDVEGISISPGERLGMVIKYKNNTVYELRNATIKTFVKGNILDMKSLVVDNGGAVDPTTKAVIWNPGGTENLRLVAPGASGELRFSLFARAKPIVRTKTDKNLTAQFRSTIEIAQIPKELVGTTLATEHTLDLKVKSIVILAAKALYRSSVLPNSGPLPPRPGKKTTYAIVWEIRNFTNDIKDTEVRASLPPNIKWENVFYPKNSRISYDPALGEVKWSIGDLKAGTGVLTLALTAMFRVSLTPADSDIGRSPVLIKDSVLTGTDGFTGDKIEKQFDPLTIELRKDKATNNNQWAVVK